MPAIPDDSCSIARSLGVLGDRWTFLILRDAIEGFTRFQEFQWSLGVATSVLTSRLSALVEHGVLTKVDYQEPGRRRRSEYLLTDAGRELFVVIAGLQQWGDRHLPYEPGASMRRVDERTGEGVRVGFIDEGGAEVPPERVQLRSTSTYPAQRLEARRRAHAA